MSDQSDDQTEATLEKTRAVVAEMTAEQAKAADAVLEPSTEEAVEEEDVEVSEGWDVYTKEELQDELRNRGLATSGNKDELIARLEEDEG